MATILVVDDEKNYLWMLEELFHREDYQVVTCEKPVEALTMIQTREIDVLLTDLKMAEMDGISLLKNAMAIAPTLSTIIMTAYGTVERAVEAMQHGAYDFVLKPFKNADLLRTVGKALERTALLRANRSLRDSLATEHWCNQLIGKSVAMQDVFDKIDRVVNSKCTVLITGESGSGKELVARALHLQGPRYAGPFIPINCGSLTDSLADSELFGHERGAFTGATGKHLGVFEQAHEGTLFLDEIGELPLPLQAKLLRALDTQEIRRVGSEKAIQLDVRILAASNRDLKAEVKSGRFREDLLFRLNVVRIDVPPLRGRIDDIPLLAEACLARAARQEGVQEKTVSAQAHAKLVGYSWPGNVRELYNVMAQAALIAKTDEILAEDLLMEPIDDSEWLDSLDRVLPKHTPLNLLLKSIERHVICRALDQCNGVQAKAAEALGMSRSLLQYKLKVLGRPPAPSE